MTTPAPVAVFNGMASSLYPLGPWRTFAISNKGGPWRLACPGSGDWAFVGDRVTVDAQGQLVRVGKP